MTENLTEQVQQAREEKYPFSYTHEMYRADIEAFESNHGAVKYVPEVLIAFGTPNINNRAEVEFL